MGKQRKSLAKGETPATIALSDATKGQVRDSASHHVETRPARARNGPLCAAEQRSQGALRSLQRTPPLLTWLACLSATRRSRVQRVCKPVRLGEQRREHLVAPRQGAVHSGAFSLVTFFGQAKKVTRQRRNHSKASPQGLPKKGSPQTAPLSESLRGKDSHATRATNPLCAAE